MKKQFVNTEKSSMFVMLFAKQQYSSSKVFFYALNSAKAVNILGYQTPLTDYLALQSDCCLATTEGDSLSYFNLFTNNFIRKMPNNNEVRTSVNNSNAHSTPTERNTVPIKAFNIEKNAKNRAYAFILYHNLLNDFSEFCKATANVQDPHELCLTLLTEKL